MRKENHIKEKIKRLQRRRVISRERFGLRWSERKPIEKRKNKKEVKFHNERIHESKITTSSEPLSSKELNRVFPTEREKPRIEKRLRKEKTVVFTTQLRVEQKKMFTEKRERKQEKTKRYLHRKEIKQHKKEFKAKLSVHAKENRFLERVSVTKKEKMLLKMVKKLVKRLEGPEKKVKKSNGESQVQPATEVRKNEKKKVAVLRFSIALVLWLLIEKRGKVEDLKVSQKEKFQETTHLAKQEPRPWILLSIIWHLAAIREFGLAKPIAKKKKIKKLLTLPANGIIFARAS